MKITEPDDLVDRVADINGISGFRDFVFIYKFLTPYLPEKDNKQLSLPLQRPLFQLSPTGLLQLTRCPEWFVATYPMSSRKWRSSCPSGDSLTQRSVISRESALVS